MMHKKAPFYQKALLIILGLCVAIALLEASLRLGGFALRSLQEYRNLQSLKHKGTYRIMCLGESTTANQYPPFLEDILNRCRVGVQFSVIDQGFNGTNSTIILARLESNLSQYHPDMVVAMMGSNDRSMLYYKDIPEAATGLFRYCKTYRLFRLLWVHIFSGRRQVIAEKPRDDRAYVELGRLYRNQGKFPQAEDAFKQAIALDPRNAEAYVKLGGLYRDQGMPFQSEAAFKKAIELDPANDQACAELGWFYRYQNRIAEAEGLFKQAIAARPQSDRIYAELGWFYQEQRRPAQSEAAFKKAIELNPANDHAYTGLGRLYRDQNKPSQAEDALKQAIALNPKNSRAYAELGGLYREQGRLAQVESLFTRSIIPDPKGSRANALSPKNERAYRTLAVVCEEMGKPELAKEYAQKAGKLRSLYCDPLTAKNYRRLKEVLDRKGIRLVCVQYPLRSIEPFRRIFEGDGEGVIFVDNEKIFRDAVKKDGYTAYFVDMFGGDFGHCTPRGNRLLAENIANAILKEAFHMQKAVF
ncbi:MAG TPA: tetratricopeptide repeat protein [Patescibacteria group bacterium]|nr:tetratricopeptide repeat protein [Patescibacteria group bacterium]